MADDGSSFELQDVRSMIAEKIAALGEEIATEVVVAHVERDKKRKVDALVKVMDMLDTTNKDFNKLGPDNVTYGEDGKKATETFSKKRIDERAKAKGRITKLTNAINKALKGDFGDLFNLASGKPEAADSSSDNSSDSSDAS